MLGAKANRAAKQTSPEVHALGLFSLIPIAKHIVIVAMLSCIRWKSSAPSRQCPRNGLLTEPWPLFISSDGDSRYGLLSTTFLKALYIQQPDLTHLTVSLCGYGVECCQKRKPSIELGFVKMGDKRLRQQPPVILPVNALTNKDRGPYRLIRRHDHRSDLFSGQLPRFLILNKSSLL